MKWDVRDTIVIFVMKVSTGPNLTVLGFPSRRFPFRRMPVNSCHVPIRVLRLGMLLESLFPCFKYLLFCLLSRHLCISIHSIAPFGKYMDSTSN